MLMRVAIGIWKNDLEQAIRTYQLLSERWCGLGSSCALQPDDAACSSNSCCAVLQAMLYIVVNTASSTFL
jgi:hypothetical protein